MDESTARRLYEVNGDVVGALNAYEQLWEQQKQNSVASDDNKDDDETAFPRSRIQRHNSLILEHSVQQRGEADSASMLSELRQMMQQAKEKGEKLKDQQQQWLALVYNVGLALFLQGKYEESSRALFMAFPRESLQLMQQSCNKNTKPQSCHVLHVQIAFAILDCILALSAGLGKLVSLELSDVVNGDANSPTKITAEKILAWIEKANHPPSTSESDGGELSERKFRLALYRSRVYFCKSDARETKVRLAKKELKTAFEVFSSKKLRTAAAESNSMGSSSDLYDIQQQLTTNSGGGASRTGDQTWLLAQQNQYALYLKANLEQIKDNPKKSLKLCAEARLNSTSSYAEEGALHSNNLAILHQNSGRCHVALHYYYAKALQQLVGSSVSSNNCCEIWHNAALCALQVQEYGLAYECLTKCVSHRPETNLYARRPRSWFRMAEACIGIHTEQKKRKRNFPFLLVKSNGGAAGIILQSENTPTKVAYEEDVAVLGSSEDIHRVNNNPLHRALSCLQKALRLCNILDDDDCLQSTRVALGYVRLELHDPAAAVPLALRAISSSGTTDTALRRKATARLYACEALCSLGKISEAINVLGVTRKEISQQQGWEALVNELALSSDPKRTSMAESTIGSTSSVMSTLQRNFDEAKAFARAASNGGRERSLDGHRAFLFSLLKEGDRENSLKAVHSMY